MKRAWFSKFRQGIARSEKGRHALLQMDIERLDVPLARRPQTGAARPSPTSPASAPCWSPGHDRARAAPRRRACAARHARRIQCHLRESGLR